MADDDIQKIGLDATDYINPVLRIIEVNSKWEAQLRGLAEALNTGEDGLEGLVVRLNKTTESGEKLNASLANTGKGFEVTANSISLTTAALQDGIEFRRLFIQTLDQQLAKERELAIANRATDATNPTLITNFIKNDNFEEQKLQQQQMNELSKAREVEERRIQTVLDAQSNQFTALIAKGRELNAQDRAREQIASRLAAELARVQQAETAQAFGQGLSSRFVTGAAGFQSANIAQINNVTAAVGRLQKLIAEEAVSVQRSEQIIEAVQNRTGEVFSGQEANVARAASQMITASNSLGQAANAIGLSWQSMARILITQQIHLIVYAFVNALKEGVRSAEQFEIRISEIRTIAQDNQLAFGTWARSVEELSNQFGNPILDVAEGAYQTLSNQVAKGADTFVFMAHALEFSQVTLATTKDSVNLLASALNSFHLGLDQVNRVQAVFFNTIELGRLRAEDLANIFGRVAPLAHSLGVSFEETNAAIATLTVNGIPANEAMTLINNVLTHLLNPTKAMKDLFQQLGVTSGEAAIATFGFAGTLDRIEKASAGSASEIAELFKDIRAIRGALDLTGPALQNFKANLVAIEEVAPFDLAKKISVESAGKQFQLEMNEIKNFFINDFGVSFIDAAESVSHALQSMGLAEHGLVSVVKGSITVLTTAIEVLLGYWGVSRAVAFAQRLVTVGAIAESEAVLGVAVAGEAAAARTALFGGSLTRLATFIASPTGALTAFAAALIFLYNESSNAAREAQRQLDSFEEDAQRLAAETTKKFHEQLDAQTRTLESNLDIRFRAYLDNSSKVNVLLSALSDQEKQRFKSIAEDVKASFELATKAIQANLEKVTQQSRTAQSEIEAARRAIEETVSGLKKTQFETGLKLLPGPDQVSALFKHINDEVQGSNKLLGTKTTDADTAKRNREEAQKLTNAAASEAVALAEREAKARDKVKELNDQIAEIEKRQSAHTNIQGETAALNEAKELESKFALAKQKHHDAEAQQLRVKIDLLRKSVTESRTDEQNREEQAHLDKLKEQRKEQEAIVKEFQKHADIQKVANTIQDKYVAGLKTYLETINKIEAKNNDIAEQEKQRLVQLRLTLDAVDKVKVPTGITNQDQLEKFINQNFDAPIQKAIENGAINSQDLLLKLQEERKQLEIAGNDEILQARQKATDSAFISQKENIRKLLDEESAAINKTTDLRAKDFALFKTGIFGSVNDKGAVTPAILNNIVHGADTLNSNRDSFNTSVLKKGLEETLTSFSKGQISGKDLQKAIADFEAAISQEINIVPGKQSATDTTSAGAQLEKLFNQLTFAGFQLSHSQTTLVDLNKQEAKSKEDLRKLGVTDEAQVDQTTKLAAANTSYAQSITESITQVNKLNGAIANLAGTLSSIPIPKFHTPGTLQTDGTSTVNNIDVQLTVNSPTPVDATTLQNAINEGIRRGQFQLASPKR